MKKMGSFVYFPCFVPELWSLDCPDECIFCYFLLTSARNLSQAIYIYASESSHSTFSENDMVYRGLSHRSWDISD